MTRSLHHTRWISAVVVLVIALAPACGSDGDGAIDSSTDTVETTMTSPTTTQSSGTSSTTAPSSTSTATSTSEPEPDGTGERVDFELFRYSVFVPTGFELDFAGTRTAFFSSDDGEDGGGFGAMLEVTNFLGGDEPTDWVSWLGESEVKTDETVSVPIHPAANPAEPGGGSVEARQLQLAGGFLGDRWVRIFELGGRSMVATVTIGDESGDAADPIQVLDAVHLWDGTFTPISIEQCSTLGLDGLELSNGEALTEAQIAIAGRIIDALIACDWDGLEAAIDPNGFTASFGGGQPIELWQDAERYDDGVLRTLYDLFTVPASVDEEGFAIWPRAAAVDWAAVDESMEAELSALGYTDRDLAGFDEFGGYIGYRTGIDEGGKWQFFVAGD